MNLFYSDFDKRFLSALTTPSTTQIDGKPSSAQVIREMAEIWVDSGGEASGFDEQYITQLRAEIARLEGGAA
jgi:hypothetical protein